MPLYSFENTKTGKEWSEMMTISDKEEYLKNNTHIKQAITKLNIVAGVS